MDRSILLEKKRQYQRARQELSDITLTSYAIHRDLDPLLNMIAELVEQQLDIYMGMS